MKRNLTCFKFKCSHSRFKCTFLSCFNSFSALAWCVTDRQMITVLIILFYFFFRMLTYSFFSWGFYPPFKSIFITLWFLSHSFSVFSVGKLNFMWFSSLFDSFIVCSNSLFVDYFFSLSWFSFPNYSLNVCFSMRSFVHLSVCFFFFVLSNSISVHDSFMRKLLTWKWLFCCVCCCYECS